ncbi:hypothetical protein O3G_MSEX011893 [Manduca sexta]|uniref:Uncharacterized protein n=1 Tax=Manduca sexta TaxID=7130 RepID=A0A921ZM94_MANSE|nr:hypothetical protein O3G_MSEX011893 [Manduca sexta]KAG6460292.1 hypothetical protein O3G_MSEX011893 [Manduca sexta]
MYITVNLLVVDLQYVRIRLGARCEGNKCTKQRQKEHILIAFFKKRYILIYITSDNTPS